MAFSQEIKAFIKNTPWAIDGKLQSNILRTVENEFARLTNFSPQIKFSLLTPMYNTSPRHLQELIWSCLAQTWGNWELILVDDGSPQKEHLQTAKDASQKDARIKFIQSPINGGISQGRNTGLPYATGDYIGILDHDDLLHPQALGIFGRAILEASQKPTFLFSNECKISDDSTILSDFFYKPRFCKSTLLRSNYIAHLTFIDRNILLETTAGKNTWYRSEFDGVEDHDFFLRISDHPRFHPIHIPLFTYLWRKAPTSTSAAVSAKPYVYERGRKMIASYLTSCGVPFEAIHAALTQGGNRFFRVLLKQSTGTPQHVVIIVPFKDKAALTIKCLESLELQTFIAKIILVDNDSSQAERSKISNWLEQPKRKQKYQLETYQGCFNFSAMNNQFIQKHAGLADIVGFLNNDVEFLTPSAIEQIIAELVFNKNLGFVGMRLWYPSKMETQHAGIKFGPERIGAGYLRPTHIQTDQDFASDEHCVAAVTFAASFCRKTLWDELKGLEDYWLPNGFGDVDICLRAYELGYQNFYIGSVEGIHHESKTRQGFDEDIELYKLYDKHAHAILTLQIARLEYDAFGYLGGNENVKPLRYMAVDRLNAILKNWIRPVHGIVKRFLLKQS